MPDQDDVARVTAFYPVADITPAEFERFVVELLGSVAPLVDDLETRLHDKVEGVDGVYDFDATVRFRFGGMSFLTVVEAKRYTGPIKRALVQILHAKLQSVGAQKAVMIATAPYQSGALNYAKTHGIALVTVTEGRFTYEARSAGGLSAMSREEARLRLGSPDFVGHTYGIGDDHNATRVTRLTPDAPEYVAEELFGIGRPPTT